MSNLGSRLPQTSRSRRRKIVLDLNAPPPGDNPDQAGSSANAKSAEQSHHLVVSLPAAPIDVDAYDDDVVISSARAFTQAKNHSRRRQGRVVVVDVESEGSSSEHSRNNRRRVVPDETTTNSINLEGSGSSKTVAIAPSRALIYVPICMGPFVEEMSTKCGHIFCKACIKTSIATLPSCPTCRTKITIMDIFRIFLPTTN